MKKSIFLSFMFPFIFSLAFAQKPLQDVVYLKNGSVVKGTIIEQIPNQSIKIKTADGSVFVYRFDEIEKMTKEEPIAQSVGAASTRKGVYLGITLDPSISYYYNNQLGGFNYEGVTVSSQRVHGAVAGGLTFSIYPTNAFGIVTGFTFENYGTTYTFSGFTPQELNISTHLTYFTIPILCSFITGEPDEPAFYIEGGPELGGFMGGKVKIAGTFVTNQTESISDAYHSFQLFGDVSFGAHIPIASDRFALDVGPYLIYSILNAFRTDYATTDTQVSTFGSGIALHFSWHMQ